MWKVQAKDLRILPCEYENTTSATSIMQFQKQIFEVKATKSVSPVAIATVMLGTEREGNLEVINTTW